MTKIYDKDQVQHRDRDLFDLPEKLASTSQLVHAAVLVIGTKGVLLNGSTSSGKSLLQRLVRERAAAQGLFSALVSDDYVRIARSAGQGDEAGSLMAFAPLATMDRQEVHGVGILSLGASRAEHAALSPVCLHLWVDLVEEADIARSPSRIDRQLDVLGDPVFHLAVPKRQALRAADMIFAALSTC